MNSSKLYREASREELRLVVEKHFHTERFQYELLSGGMFNTTYLLSLPGGGKHVLRMGAVNRHLLLPFERDLMRAERYFYSLCRLRGIPVPQVEALELDQRSLGRDYMIRGYGPASGGSPPLPPRAG